MNFHPTYPTPPPGYMPYDYIRTPPVSPSPGAHGYYSPRYAANTATPSPRGSPKTHARRSSQQEPPAYAYTSSRGAPQYFQGYSSPRYFASQQSTPQRNPDYVSNFDYTRTKSRHYRDMDGLPSMHRSSRESKRRPSHSRYAHTTQVFDDGYAYVYDSNVYDTPPPPYEPYARYQSYGRNTDHYYHDQVPIYTEAEPTSRSRPRRASHSSRPQPPTPKRPSTAKATPRATEEDARRAGIPAGYSYKNWDPTEEPIMLLGSVFDANSLGKWIYDWTVFHHGPSTPLSEIAGELWLLLIQLAGKVKRAEECMTKIRKTESREMVEDFLESGERLWIRFAKLLKVCEDYMWKAAKKETGDKKPVTMGKNSGCEFVDSIFGRDRELEKTEKLMTGMRLWSMRFDANCDDILRYPSA
ncbi:uncharacterized protein BDZ99DRAFT_568586 [Mytilinidion resinicola]|uniref:Vegetative cell wall protein gp1 n=1 Tax=Mytilinidion resinicola TaxID=574789 RepID=A0A6A6YX39_9PEZI|nr:uncharacterized protein BDZ99DRAFT_568586 [Mytilinidion resinicola]KAF2813371.1 hypothetical protein BDZ99DRAFT_568586 [Mytilinidion resinicola]